MSVDRFEQFNFFAGDVNRSQCIHELSVFKSPRICLPGTKSYFFFKRRSKCWSFWLRYSTECSRPGAEGKGFLWGSGQQCVMAGMALRDGEVVSRRLVPHTSVCVSACKWRMCAWVSMCVGGCRQVSVSVCPCECVNTKQGCLGGRWVCLWGDIDLKIKSQPKS